MRGIWLRDPRGLDWDKVMSQLRASGLNTLFVNFATGGAAFYPSALVPQISERDEMALCLAAARRHGIAVHAKLICFFAYLSPTEFQQELARARRGIRDSGGRWHRQAGDLWLDPLQAANRQHIVALAREIVQRYDVDGLQLDYVRFPEMNDTTRTAQAVVIEEVVRQVRSELHRTRPGIPLSVAVFHDLHRARSEMGQDWLSWARRRLVEFVCPMDYVTDNQRLAEMILAQKHLLKGAVPMFVGVGAYKFSDAGDLAAQIGLARRLNPQGFVLFAYTEEFGATMLPRFRFAERRKQ
jgi:uncharacterized lipoprotein YddW (UPF0748 family)